MDRHFCVILVRNNQPVYYVSCLKDQMNPIVEAFKDVGGVVMMDVPHHNVYEPNIRVLMKFLDGI